MENDQLGERGGQEDDPELAIIATQLRATAEYAIDPQVKERLREKLLKEFKENCR